MKKLSMIIALILAISILAVACGGGGTSDTPPPATPAPATPAPGAGIDEEPTGEEPATGFIGYPMDAKDVTLTFWLWGGPQLHASVASWQDSPFHSGLNEHVGVNIEWMFQPAGADSESQEFNLLIASGDYPDIMFSSLIMRDAERLIDERVFRDLTPYIRDYAPNYFNWLQENAARDRAFKTDSGRYFGFGQFREAGGWNDTYQGPLIRQDWLDELGLPTPVTIDDWDKTLRAFNDAYGARFFAPWFRFDESGNIAGAFGAWGGTRTRIFVDRNDNQVKVAQVMPEWKIYAEQMAQWWRDGLIDQDITSAGDMDVRTKVTNNETGMLYTSMGQLSNILNDASDNNATSNWVGIDYPQGNDGTKNFIFGGPGINNTSASITTSVGDDRLEIAMRVLDYAYSRDGFMYWNFGTEGVSWNMVDGRPVYSDLVHNDVDGITAALEKFVGTVWNGPNIQATEVLIQRNRPQAIEANNTWFYGNEHIAQDFPIPRGMALSADEMTKAEIIEGPLRTYIDEMTVRFITGQEPIDNFDNFVQNVRNMGLDDLLALYQAAYNRWLNR